MKCESCEHWLIAEQIKGKKAIGHCLRYPRVPILFPEIEEREDALQWLYPPHFEDDRCGEYKVKKS